MYGRAGWEGNALGTEQNQSNPHLPVWHSEETVTIHMTAFGKVWSLGIVARNVGSSMAHEPQPLVVALYTDLQFK